MADETHGWTVVEEAASPKVETSPSGSIALPASAVTVAALPIAAREAMRFATSPNVPRAAATAGKAIGAVTSLPAGLSGFGSIAKGAWNGSRAGWFTGKLAQDVALPMAKALDAAAPVMGVVSDALNTGTIAQAEGDIDRKGRAYFDAIPQGESPRMVNGALAAIAERMGRPDLAAKFRGR